MKKVLALLFAVLFFSGSAFAAGKNEIVVKGGMGFFGGLSDPEIETSIDLTIPNGSNPPIVISNLNIGGLLEEIIKGKSGGRSLSMSAEYMYAPNEVIKIGVGLQYMSTKETKLSITYDSKELMSFNYNMTTLPIYATAQLSPVKQLRELYFKVNVGYGIYYDSNFNINGLAETIGSIISSESSSTIVDYKTEVKYSGGLYYGIGAGYEISDTGIIVEISYESFSGSVEHKCYDKLSSDKINFTFNTEYYQVAFKVGYKVAL